MQKLKYVIMILVSFAIFITCSNAVDVRVNFTQINLPTDAVIQNNRTYTQTKKCFKHFSLQNYNT